MGIIDESEFAELDDEGKELVKEFLGFTDKIIETFRKSEGRLIRALANGDTGELTGDEFYRYAKTLPVETYISFFRMMYADMERNHQLGLEAIKRYEGA